MKSTHKSLLHPLDRILRYMKAGRWYNDIFKQLSVFRLRSLTSNMQYMNFPSLVYYKKLMHPLASLYHFAHAYLQTTDYHARFMLHKLPALNQVKDMGATSTMYS